MKHIVIIKGLLEEYPATSGTALRTSKLAAALATSAKVTLVTHSEQYTKRQLHPNLTHYTIPLPRALHIIMRLPLPITAEQRYLLLITSRLYNRNRQLRRRIARHTRTATTIISELPYAMPYVTRQAKQRLLYHAHDVEYELRRKTLPQGLVTRFLLRRIARAERHAAQRATHVIVCTESDKTLMQRRYQLAANTITVAPNAADITHLQPASSSMRQHAKQQLGLPTSQPLLLFVGSDNPANRQARRIIAEHIAPKLPEYSFLIAGSVANSVPLTEPPAHYPNPELESDNIMAYGFYGLEHWPNKLRVRWTEQHCGWVLPGISQAIMLTAASFQPRQATIMINQQPVTTLTISSRQTYTITFPPTPAARIDIVLDTTWRTRRDPRQLGINISNLVYQNDRTTTAIDIAKLADYSLRQRDNLWYLKDFTDNLKPSIFAAADIAINPTLAGSGSNIKVAEYLAAGLPTIATTVGARGFTTNDTSAALTTSSIDNFPATITSLLQDQARYHHLAQRGRQYAEQHHSWDHSATIFSRHI